MGFEPTTLICQGTRAYPLSHQGYKETWTCWKYILKVKCEVIKETVSERKDQRIEPEICEHRVSSYSLLFTPLDRHTTDALHRRVLSPGVVDMHFHYNLDLKIWQPGFKKRNLLLVRLCPSPGSHWHSSWVFHWKTCTLTSIKNHMWVGIQLAMSQLPMTHH